MDVLCERESREHAASDQLRLIIHKLSAADVSQLLLLDAPLN